MNDYLFMSEMLDVFLEEADEQLQHLDEGILALEKSPEDMDVVKEIFRAAHTLKGSSATMGFEKLANLTHSMESLLDGIRSGKQTTTPAVIDALLKAVDALRLLVKHSRDGTLSGAKGPADASVDEIVEELKSVSRAEDVTMSRELGPVRSLQRPAQTGALKIEIKVANDCLMPSVRGCMALAALEGKGEIVCSDPPSEQLEQLQPGGSLIVQFNPSVSKDEIQSALDSLCELQAIIQEQDATKATERSADKKTSASGADGETQSHSAQTVRVGVDRLDILMNLVGELVIGRTRIGQSETELSMRYDGDPLLGSLTEASLHLGRVINELQEQIMKIRMLPVEQVFNRFPRMVRDLAQKADKKVKFLISGQETELDRSILEDIVDPITHLLRNAIDHGFETPQQRAAAGKPETGILKLAAKHEENQIIIEVEDDGRGIKAEDIKRAAIAKGAIQQESAERLNEKDCLQLLFAAGVSTAEKVTDVSGRGVGMDVVKNNIERLSGTVDIETQVGEGTRFLLRLPLTLAIVQALITSAKGRIFAIPLTSVVETARCRSSEIHTLEGHPALQFRGSVLPLTNLAEVFPSRTGSDDGLSADPVIVVVRASGLQIGIAVDSLIGEQEVVIKSLGAYFGQVEGISGAALLGDGGIALIVDTSGLAGILARHIAKVAA